MRRPDVEKIKENLAGMIRHGSSDRVPERRVAVLLCEWIESLEEWVVCYECMGRECCKCDVTMDERREGL